MVKQKQTLITLSSLNVEEILHNYYKVFDENTSSVPIGGVVLSKKSNDSKNECYETFTNSHKGITKNIIVMYDYYQNKALPQYTTKPCWWCRSTFSTQPLGCPIKYVSEENSDSENVLEMLKEQNLSTEDGTDYFEIEGIFCDFPCMKAYILHRIKITNSPVYRKSLTLLTLLCYKLTGKIMAIPTANDWRLIQEWGGVYTKEQFRELNGKVIINSSINRKRPIMYAQGICFQQSETSS